MLFTGRRTKVHSKVRASPSASLDVRPSSWTLVFVLALWSAPALATGGRLIGGTMAVLLVGSGSGWSLAITVAVRLVGPVALTLASKPSRARPLLGRAPITQMPVATS